MNWMGYLICSDIKLNGQSKLKIFQNWWVGSWSEQKKSTINLKKKKGCAKSTDWCKIKGVFDFEAKNWKNIELESTLLGLKT